ncbi:MAG: serine/threonine protein kinase, partial [Reyranella sp.]|nr:serine/threonine protein kinase [Reyranella sp.]
MTSDNDQALPLGTRLGDYRLDAVIGHGGFGITYRAFDAQLAKFVAIKEYFPVEFALRRAGGTVAPRGTRFADDFAWGRDRFLDEARALARFRHAHIVPVLRYFEANGTAYTVMEFEDGRSVAELLRMSGRRLQPDEVRRLAEGLLSGLGAVHAQGFLHRDIKPSNIIVRHDGVPVLIDFGAARQAMGGRTRTLTSILTPQYAPIEQYALDGKQGPWSDIYSAAAVLHHAVAGSPPPEAAGRVGTDPYRPLAVTQADRFEQTLLVAIDRALAFAPDQRPQSIAAWSAMFGPALPRSDEAPTVRLSPAAPRLGGAHRSGPEAVPPPLPPPRRLRTAWWVATLLVAGTLAALWRFQPELRDLIAGAPPAARPVAEVAPPAATAPPSPAPPATAPAPAPA